MRRTAITLLAAVVTILFAAGGLAGAATTTSSGDVLPSAIKLDRAAGTVTLPLFKGTHDGRTVWYVVTESSNKNDAERRGVNHAAKLTNALGTRAVQKVRVTDGVVRFAGTVNFAPKRVVVPGPEGFPPARFEPGAVGDAEYSPLITSNGHTVLNASQVANSSGRHDAVVSIDFKKRQVTDAYPPRKMKRRNLPDRMESPKHHPSKEVPSLAMVSSRPGGHQHRYSLPRLYSSH